MMVHYIEENKMDSMRNQISAPAPDAPEGLLFVQRRSPEPYEIGLTYHFTKVDGGGGNDGHYWTVVAAGLVTETQYTDDTRQGERSAWAHVRPATDSEAAARAEVIASVAAQRDAQHTHDEERQAEIAAFWARVKARAGDEYTLRGPYYTIESLSGLEVIDEVEADETVKVPDGLSSRHVAYIAPEGLVTLREKSREVRLYTDRATADSTRTAEIYSELADTERDDMLAACAELELLEDDAPAVVGTTDDEQFTYVRYGQALTAREAIEIIRERHA